MRVGDLVLTIYTQTLGIIIEKDWDMDNEVLWKVHLFDGSVIYVDTEDMEVICK